MKIDRRRALRQLCIGATSLAASPACARIAAKLDSANQGAAPAPEGQPMLTRPIPRTGETIPVIGMGTWATFDVGSSPEVRKPLEEVLAEFSRIGGKVIDSSPMYGNSEEVVGDLSARLGLRQKLFIATKVWIEGAAAGVRQMEESMRKLRADPIDLMQVHNLVDVNTQLRTLTDWQRRARIRYIGITHRTAEAYAAVERVMAAHRLDFLQINYSVQERESERRLLPMAQERGIAVIANRPFAGGELFSGLARKPVPSWAAEIDCSSWAKLTPQLAVSPRASGRILPACCPAGARIWTSQGSTT